MQNQYKNFIVFVPTNELSDRQMKKIIKFTTSSIKSKMPTNKFNQGGERLKTMRQ